MLRKLRRILCFGLCLVVALAMLLTFNGKADALGRGSSPGDLSEGADAIVAGTVVSAVGFWNADGTGIYSKVVISVEQSFKGPPSGSTITVIVPGGTIDGICQRLSDTPRFAAGDRPTLFLRQLFAEQISEKGLAISEMSLPVFELHGSHQARLHTTSRGGDDLPFGSLSDPVTGTSTDDGSESGTLQVESGTLEVDQSGFVYNGMKWFGNWPVVDYKVNAPDSASNMAVQNAASSWSSAGSEFSFDYTGTHTRAGGYRYNGVNEIVWYNLGSDGPLARAIWWYDPDTGEIVEADMEFNSYYTWSTATPTPLGSFDVETVALHEFGHWLSLGHSDIEEAIMWPYYKGAQRTLHDDDIAGIRYIYGAAVSYTISGIILDGEGTPLQGVSVSASGGHEQTVTSNDDGVYAVTGVQEGALAINITPTKSGYSFDPVGRIVGGPVTANIVDQDFTATQVAPPFDVVGSWLLSVNDGAYQHDMYITVHSETGELTGWGGAPARSGPDGYSTTWTLTGQVTGYEVEITVYYDDSAYTATITGTIDAGCDFMSGGAGTGGVTDWEATRVPCNLEGTWLLSVNDGRYQHDMYITVHSETGELTGWGGAPARSGPDGYSTTWTLTGQVTGYEVEITVYYDDSAYTATITGTIDAGCDFMSGGAGTGGVTDWEATRVPCNLEGTWLLSVNDGRYQHDMYITVHSETGELTGWGGAPAGAGPDGYSTTWTLTGQVTGYEVEITVYYDDSAYTATITGTIDIGCYSMSGGAGTGGVTDWEATRVDE